MSPKSAVAPAKFSKKEAGEKVRKRLLAKRDELLADLAKNREVSDETVDESAQDMADRATSAYTKEFAYSLSESDRKILLLIEESLGRLDDGHVRHVRELRPARPGEAARGRALGAPLPGLPGAAGQGPSLSG